MNICSLHKIPVEGQESEAWFAQVALSQQPISHDGVNRVFMHTHPLETDAIDATLWRNEDGSELTLDQRAWEMSKIMAVDHPPIHDTQNHWSALFRHSAHRLWCAKPEYADTFDYDMVYMRGMIEAGMPEALPIWDAATEGATPERIPVIMLNMISAMSNN